MRWAAALSCCFAVGCGVRTIGSLGDPQPEPSGSGGDASGVIPRSAGSGGAAGAGSSGGPLITLGGGPLAAGGSGSSSGGNSVTSAGGTNEVSAGVAGQSGSTGGGGVAESELPMLSVLPVARFKLDECEGPALDVMSDTTGVRTNVACAAGVQGSAAVFAADTAEGGRRIELADEPRFAFTHELTVAAWVKPSNGGPLRAIVSKWYGLDAFLLMVREVVDGEGLLSPRFAFAIAEPENDWGRPAEVISPSPVELDVWSHVAGVYRWSPDGKVGQITLYVNAQPVATTSTKVDTNGLQQSTRPIQIGFVEPAGSFVGSIDEVRLYDVALGPEIAWLWLDPKHD